MYGTVISASVFMMCGDEVCDELLHGMGFRVLVRRKDKKPYPILHIETDYGYRGDISEQDVLLHETRITDELHMISGTFTDVLSGPSVRSRIIKTLARGSMVRLIGDTDDGFTLIELADGVRGYVRDAFIWRHEQPPLCHSEQALRKSLLDSAMQYIGTQYRWGGKSPMGIDCSGLCFMAYRENGITIYRDATMMPGYAIHPISREQMKPADLVFLPGHVAMYAGGGLFIHSAVRNNGVAVDRLEGYLTEEMIVGSAF